MKKSSDPKVSVIIPAFNEATYIGRLLDALSKQRGASFEVIVSDAQSNDGTKEVVENSKNNLDIKFYQAPPKGPAFGRNQGAKYAQGEWLLFMDADDEIRDPHFIANLVNEAQVRNWQTATAKYYYLDASLTERIGRHINYYYTKLLSHTKHPVAPGWCILTRRELFEKHEGFNEKIQFGEDYDYVTRVGKTGFGFVESTHYFVDLRRAREEGLSLFIKGIRNEIYRHTHGYNLEKNPYSYDFGKHQKRNE